MKKTLAFSLLLTAALVIYGCSKKQPKPSDDFGPAASAQPAFSAEQVRDAIQAADADTRVGIVNQVDSRAMTAMISGLPEADIKVGDGLSIIDLAQAPVSGAYVTAVAGDSVTVKYHVISGGRPAKEGDLAIKFMK